MSKIHLILLLINLKWVHLAPKYISILLNLFDLPLDPLSKIRLIMDYRDIIYDKRNTIVCIGVAIPDFSLFFM